MSSAFEMLEVGITKEGKPFYIPRFHTLIAGASGAGKTEAARKLVSALRKMIPDLKVLIFDVKSTGRDWKGYGMDVPIYVETATDSRFLRDLIETQERRKIDWFFYELHIACQGAKTWVDVLQSLRKRYNKYKDKNQMKEEKLGTLIIYMEALVSELDKGDITTEFDLSQPITVVPLNYREDAFKQLVVYSYLTAMKRNQVKRVLIVCDEMSTLAPSMSGTGCKRIIEQYLFKQGRAAEVFGLAIDQEITGISPSVRRQCWNWILGMQTDVSAQERTIKQIPGKTLTLDDISTLGVGWWEAVIRTPSSTEVEKFYLIPEGISEEVGRKIVSGEMKVEEVMHDLHVTNLEESELKELEEAKNEIKSLKETVKNLEEEKKKREENVHAVATVAADREKLDAFRKAFSDLFGGFSGLEQIGQLSYNYNQVVLPRLDRMEKVVKSFAERASGTTGQNIGLEKQDTVITVSHKSDLVNMTTEKLEGKVMYVIVTHFAEKEFKEEDLVPFLENYGWQIQHSSLAPILGSTLPKKGLVRKCGKGTYKLPDYVKVNVTKGES